MKIGFFGLGNMGYPMALNLVKAGYIVKGFDIVESQREKFSSEGGQGVASTKDCVENVDIIITMLPSGKIVKELYLGDLGILSLAKEGSVLIDCSTIAASDAKAVAAEAQRRNFPMIDAPVSGGVGGAQAGTLTFIVGGSEDSLVKAKPVLEKMGKNIFHAGESGAGQVAKSVIICFLLFI